MDSERNKPPRTYREIPLRAHRERYEAQPQRHEVPPQRSQEARPQPRRRPRRKRSIWPILLTGCGLGIVLTVLAAAVIVFLAVRGTPGNSLSNLPGLGGLQTFTHEETQAIPLTTISQMQVCDKIGNVTILVDPQASQTIVTSKKIVHSASQNEANQEFKRIAVEIQPPGTISNTLSCPKPQTPPTPSGTATPGTTTTAGNPNGALLVNITIPNSGGLLPETSDSVDVSITLPPTVLPPNGPTMFVDVEAPVGKVKVDGLGGILNITGSTGDVAVSHAMLANGSHIETGQGNVTFDGRLVIPSSSDPQQAARFMLLSERGNIDVTLPAETNVTLDANTNIGMITSSFDIKTTVTDGSVSYHGPLNTVAEVQPATLLLDVSTGNITLHKAAP